MDEISPPTGAAGRKPNDHRHQQSYGAYGFEGSHARTYNDDSQDTSSDTPADSTTIQTVDDYSTIQTTKDHRLKPNNALSEQNVHKYSSNQQVMASPPPLQISTRSETRTEDMKFNGVGTQSTNQREPVPGIAAIVQKEAKKNIIPHDRLGTAPTPTAANTATTPRSQALDLKHNDNAFQVIASLVVDKFDVHLRLKAISITITLDDRHHLDRVVPDKKRFAEAVRYRLQSCPEHSMKAIHVITRKCRALGLDREGSQNILNAAVGSTVRLSVSVRARCSVLYVANDVLGIEATKQLILSFICCFSFLLHKVG
jgi:hypothetical protein